MNCPNNLSKSDRYWFDLIQQCRTSGKSDFQWLQENNIKSPTFYYHVKRLRNKACEIPKNVRTIKQEVQEVVPVYFESPNVPETVLKEQTESVVAVRLQLHGVCVEITNCASQEIIQTTLSALQGLC